jgi:plasmid stabilization system protein ParE
MSNNQRFTVTWLRLALQDIHECAEYIAQDDPNAAKLVAERIWLEGQSLRVMPDRGRPGRVPGTRELVLQGLPYFIAYQAKGKNVEILRVIHTSRNWPPKQ